jgi:isopenicillin N synthase-like dioxygenase
MDVLPIIDLGSSGEADGASPTRIVAEVGAACRDVGFFYVVNHGVARELIAKAFGQSHDFFALPVADKRKLAIETIGGNRGYSGLFTRRSTPPAART